MRELATFSVDDRLRKSKARVVTEIRAILGDFPDSRILRVRVSESRVLQVPRRPQAIFRAEVKSQLRWYRRNMRKLELQLSRINAGKYDHAKYPDMATARAGWWGRHDAIIDVHEGWLEAQREHIHVRNPFQRVDGRQEYRITRRGW
jgi:hypothetical protein